jgi:hypothetical protein
MRISNTSRKTRKKPSANKASVGMRLLPKIERAAPHLSADVSFNRHSIGDKPCRAKDNPGFAGGC